MTTLFGGAAIGGIQATDGSPGITVCTTFTFHRGGTGVAGQVTEVWWYCGANTGGTWTALGWEVTHNDSGGAGTGTLVANQAFVGTPTANAWNKVTLSAPVAIAADYNRRWRFGIHNPNNYWADNSFFSVHDETNAPITAYRDNDTTSTLGMLSQGTFALGSTVTTYPASVGASANYGIDVTFIETGGTISSSVTAGGTQGLTLAGALKSTVTRGGTQAVTLAGGIGSTLTKGGVQALTLAGQLRYPVTLGGVQDLSLEGTVTGGTAPESPAGWETIRGAINEARAQHLKHEERRHHPIDCPVHLWPLEIVGNVYHCKFGGHVVRLPAPSP